MVLTNEQYQLLGLNKKDRTLIEGLTDQSLSFTVLARKVKIPRTSLYTRIKHLLKRGLITEVRVGKRKQYVLVSREVLQGYFEELADHFSMIEKKKSKSFILHGRVSSEYLVYRGIENLVALYKRFGDLDKYSRIYTLQPNISAYSVMKAFPYDELVKINQRIKDRKIIVEAVLQENFIDFYKNKLRQENKPIKDIFEAYGGRMADTHYISQKYINFDSELMMTKDFAVIANWQEHVAVEIRDKETVGILLELFGFIKSQSSKVDQNPVVKKIIEAVQ